MTIMAGVDIGGTKCAVCVGQEQAGEIAILGKRRFPTPAAPHLALEQIGAELSGLLAELRLASPAALGIACGGPLDSRRGLVLAPPNLPHWDGIDVIAPLRARFGVPVGLQNDANACALAEWRWGAGRGCQNMIFLTFGTGMGSGLILDGRLYSGANDNAGEVGHWRLEPDGPTGYGKAGSFEGFCSGGGIAQLARALAAAALRAGRAPLFCAEPAGLGLITAESVAEAALRGDELALQVFDSVAQHLGRGLALLVDVLNPERIVIGSIYARQHHLLAEKTLAVLRQEALPLALAVCQVVPAGLGEAVGDLAALSVAMSLVWAAGRV